MALRLVPILAVLLAVICVVSSGGGYGHSERDGEGEGCPEQGGSDCRDEGNKGDDSYLDENNGRDGTEQDDKDNGMKSEDKKMSDDKKEEQKPGDEQEGDKNPGGDEQEGDKNPGGDEQEGDKNPGGDMESEEDNGSTRLKDTLKNKGLKLSVWGVVVIALSAILVVIAAASIAICCCKPKKKPSTAAVLPYEVKEKDQPPSYNGSLFDMKKDGISYTVPICFEERPPADPLHPPSYSSINLRQGDETSTVTVITPPIQPPRKETPPPKY
ncbi:uncharacterized protein [Watersipora subatra]|uniref:uncharacterized protein n=1 Tax=Watersipora subatra TaxID=2589382 RepID=UPI00355B7A4B